jgi:hypothetical protein
LISLLHWINATQEKSIKKKIVIDISSSLDQCHLGKEYQEKDRDIVGDLR